MILGGLFILRVRPTTEEPLFCCSAVDVSTVGLLQRRPARQLAIFAARTVAKRVQASSMNQVNHEGLVVYVVSRADGLVAVAVTDAEYNRRVAFGLLARLLADFSEAFVGKWERAEGVRDNWLRWPALDQALVQYQHPETADKVLRLQRDIDDTKAVVFDDLEKVLGQNERLTELLRSSDDLSADALAFLEAAKKTNSRCGCVML